MNPEIYILVNSEGICENKFLWDGVTPWTQPENTLICKETELGIIIEIGELVKQDLSIPILDEDEALNSPELDEGGSDFLENVI